jgi:DNA-binding NarL/FixJ family response regulator
LMRPRVLLADDYPGMVTAVARLLSLDCEVVGTVADASALLESAQRLQPDLIVLDLNLPDLSGLEVCRQITQAHPQTKIIVFTAVTDPEVRQRSLAVGASAFVSKLGPVTDLLAAIKRLSVEP